LPFLLGSPISVGTTFPPLRIRPALTGVDFWAFYVFPSPFVKPRSPGSLLELSVIRGRFASFSVFFRFFCFCTRCPLPDVPNDCASVVDQGLLFLLAALLLVAPVRPVP